MKYCSSSSNCTDTDTENSNKIYTCTIARVNIIKVTLHFELCYIPGIVVCIYIYIYIIIYNIYVNFFIIINFMWYVV